MRKLALLVFFVLILSFGVNAKEQARDDVEVTITSENNQITANDFAIFDVRVASNLLRNSDFFVAKNFYSDKWRVTADPYILSVQSGYGETTRLKVTPLGFLAPGKYNLILTVESRDKTVVKEVPLEVEIIPFGEENVKTDLIVDDKIDPRTGAVARIKLENLFNHDVEDVTILFTSELFDFKREVELKANEIKIEKFNLEFETNVALREYLFRVNVKSGHEVLGGASKKVEFTPYAEVTEKIFRSNNFNKKIVVTKENTGTEESTETVSIELTSFENLLATYNVKPDEVESGDGTHTAFWTFNLNPGDRRDIIITLPYGTYLAGLLLIIVVIYMGLYVSRKKVVLVKRVMDVHKDQEGIRGIKIILHLTNRGNKAIHKIRVIDYLPKLVAASSKDFTTMKPSKVQRSADGRMRLVWDLDGLDRGEERIISYVAKSKLSIIGRLALPDAVVEYYSGRKYVHVCSNKLTLLTKESEKEKKSD